MPRTLVTGGSGFIGTNLVAELRNLGEEVLNLDVAPPLDPEHSAAWVPCDLRERRAVDDVVASFRPERVVHLAAEARVVHDWGLERYDVNTVGTRNLLLSLSDAGSVDRATIVSTQYVCRPGYEPQNDEDYAPHTVYGYSKAVAEATTRRASLPFEWCIARPTTIWGPWDLKYRRDFYWSIRHGWYLHPSGPPSIRSMGYVGNLVQQLVGLLHATGGSLHERTFYLGDRPAPLDQYVDAFALRLTSKPARRAPRPLMGTAAAVGDVLQSAGLSAPLTTKRYRSMIDDYLVDVGPIHELVGEPHVDLRTGVDTTVDWLERGGFEHGWRSWRFS